MAKKSKYIEQDIARGGLKAVSKLFRKKSSVKQAGKLRRLITPQFRKTKVKRQLSPQQKIARARFRQLQRERGMSNRNYRDVVAYHNQQKQRKMLENMARNNQLSPSARQILNHLQKTQTQAFRDDNRQQRLLREKKALSSAMNLMKAHENMRPVRMDFTGVNPEENILMARNVFKENPENNILRSNRRTILDTRENRLKF